MHEKNILKVEVNKEIGSDIKIQRFEDVVDDDHYYQAPTLRRSRDGVIRINVDNNNNTAVIPERKTLDAADYLQQQQQQQRVQTLVIDDANNDKYSRRAVNIEGQTHVHKNEVQINDKQRGVYDELYEQKKSAVEELNRKIEMIERERANQVKVRAAEVVDKTTSRRLPPSHVVDVDGLVEKNVKVTVDIKSEEPKVPRPVHTIVDEEIKRTSRVTYEDSVNVDSKHKITLDDDEESFDEWTEVCFVSSILTANGIYWINA